MEKSILDALNSADITETQIKELYLKHKVYVDDHPDLKSRIREATMEYRRLSHVRYCMIFEGKTVRSPSAKLRAINWL